MTRRLIGAARVRIGLHPSPRAGPHFSINEGACCGITAYSTHTASAESLEREQQTNASVAGMQAVAVNLQFRAYEHHVAELARDPAVVALLASPGGFSETLRERLGPFDSLFVMAPDARQRGRTSVKPTEYLLMLAFIALTRPPAVGASPVKIRASCLNARHF